MTESDLLLLYWNRRLAIEGPIDIAWRACCCAHMLIGAKLVFCRYPFTGLLLLQIGFYNLLALEVWLGWPGINVELVVLDILRSWSGF